jgi:uncharacterized protein (TIRG00374 family)
MTDDAAPPEEPAAGSSDSGSADDGSPEQEKPSRTKQIIAGVVTLLVLVLVFGIVFPQFADYDKAWEAIKGMSNWALLALGVATIVNIIIYVWPYQAALPELRYWPAFVVRQTSFMISNVVPLGGAFGLAVQYAMLGSYGFGSAPTTATIGITSVWNLFVTLSLPVFGAIGLIFLGQATSAVWVAAGVGLLIVGGMVVLFAVALRSDDQARRIGGWGDSVVSWFFGLFRREYEPGIADWMVSFRDSTIEVISARWQMITATNVLQQLAQFAILAIAVFAIQGEGSDNTVNLIEVFAAFAFARLGGFIPLTPGGLGTIDALLVAFLTTAGLTNDQAVAADMVWRALSYFPQVFIGIGTFLYWRARETKKAAAGTPSSP